MAILTLDQAKLAVGIDTDDTTDDIELQAYVDAIGAPIENWTKTVVEQRTVTETISGSGRGRIVLRYTPVTELTSIGTVDGSATWDVADWTIVDADLGIIAATAGTGLRGMVQITYKAGYTADNIPANMKQAALIILQHIWESQRGVAGVQAGAIGEEELHDRLYSYSIPRKALEWLGSEGVVVA